MGVVDRKQELLMNIVRLRRAGRNATGDPNIAEVRATLERDLGETVSRRLAARLLGVSHTALERWIRSGDLPVVYTSAGRTEMPVPALLDLYETVEGNRSRHPGRYALLPAMTRQREAARRLRVRQPGDGTPLPSHDRARARSLAYHRGVAQRLRKPMVDEARHALFRWREQGKIEDTYAQAWEQLLDRPIPEIRRALVEEGELADDLRQNSPFAGLLSEPERRKILSEVR